MKATQASFRPGLDSSGFTMVELMVALAMATFFIAVTFTMVDFSSQSYRAQERVVDVQQDMRAALNFIARDIRMAGYDPMRGSGAAIVAADGASLRFTADLNRSNTVDEAAEEQVTYAYNAANQTLDRILYQGTGSETAPVTLIENVSAFAFAYQDADDANTAGATARVVRISITCQDRDAKGQTFARTLNAVIKCRNL